MSFEKAQKDTSLQRKVSTQTRSSLVSQAYGMLYMQGSDHLQNNGYGTQVASSMGMGSIFPMIQPKLTIGQPNDKYEQEADHIAKSVVSKINHPTTDSSIENINAINGNNQVSQRIMKMTAPKELSEAETDIEGKIESSRGSGRALPDEVKTPMENAFGADFSNVRIHTDNNSDKLNKTIQAKAFTTGSDIYFKSGEFKPESKEGQELVAHELTHVRQQTGAIAKGTGGDSVQRTINTSLSSSQVIQRFEDEFSDDSVDVWLTYFDKVLTEIREYVSTKDWAKIGAGTCIGARKKLNAFKEKYSRAELAKLRKNLKEKGAEVRKLTLMEEKVKIISQEINEAVKIKDNQKGTSDTSVSKEEINKETGKESVNENDKSSTALEGIIKKTAGWDEFKSIASVLKLDLEKLLNNFIRLLGEIPKKSINQSFLTNLFSTTKECYERGYENKLVDIKSFVDHLKKLEDNVDRGGYSGILAELQAMNALLVKGDIVPERPIIMGEMRERTLPFKKALWKQDIDLQYVDSKGVFQYLEVKDKVTTLETKMNHLIGEAAFDPSPDGTNFSKDDSRQIASLVQIVNDDEVKGQNSNLTVCCISPLGWVRFMTTPHVLQLIKYNVSLEIANVLFTPEDLKLLVEYVKRELNSLDPKWEEKSKDESLPIRKEIGKESRHQTQWNLEAANAYPPKPEILRELNK